MVNQIFDKGLGTLRPFFLESVEELPGLESGPERGGIDSVIELATVKQVCKRVDNFTTRLVGVLQKF